MEHDGIHELPVGDNLSFADPDGIAVEFYFLRAALPAKQLTPVESRRNRTRMDAMTRATGHRCDPRPRRWPRAKPDDVDWWS